MLVRKTKTIGPKRESSAHRKGNYTVFTRHIIILSIDTREDHLILTTTGGQQYAHIRLNQLKGTEEEEEEEAKATAAAAAEEEK